MGWTERKGKGRSGRRLFFWGGFLLFFFFFPLVSCVFLFYAEEVAIHDTMIPQVCSDDDLLVPT